MAKENDRLEYSAKDSHLEKASGKEIQEPARQAKCQLCSLVARDEMELHKHMINAHPA